jgi:large-conductance mechanosensitive channel
MKTQKNPRLKNLSTLVMILVFILVQNISHTLLAQSQSVDNQEDKLFFLQQALPAFGLIVATAVLFLLVAKVLSLKPKPKEEEMQLDEIEEETRQLERLKNSVGDWEQIAPFSRKGTFVFNHDERDFLVEIYETDTKSRKRKSAQRSTRKRGRVLNVLLLLY